MKRTPQHKALYAIIDQMTGRFAAPPSSLAKLSSDYVDKLNSESLHIQDPMGKLIPRFALETYRWVRTRPDPTPKKPAKSKPAKK